MKRKRAPRRESRRQEIITTTESSHVITHSRIPPRNRQKKKKKKTLKHDQKRAKINERVEVPNNKAPKRHDLVVELPERQRVCAEVTDIKP